MPAPPQDDRTARPPGKPPIALSIAGFDPSNGAGITADLQVFAAHHLFGTTAITALTVQSTLGVASTYPVDPAILTQTLQHLSADLPPAGIKIGMLATTAIVEAVAAFLRSAISMVPVVLDPVITASSGTPLLEPAAIEALHAHLIPGAAWITPNWGELALLTSTPIHDIHDAQRAMLILGRRHPRLYIVATAGDQSHPADLLRTPEGIFHVFSGDHVETTSTHGTGCAFSSALLSQLVLGASPVEAVAAAKAYVTGTLQQAPGIGHGKGPIGLLWPLRSK